MVKPFMGTGLLVLGVIFVTLGACRPATEAWPPKRSAIEALRGSGDSLEGFARALEPRTFVFPDDHGPHGDFAVEWWYFTGSLESASGERWGYQLTFFRRALTASASIRPSAWATNQIYLAHAALTDATGNAFVAAERISRGALGLAGVRTVPFRAWIDHWQAASRDENGLFPLVLEIEAETAEGTSFALDLLLEAGKPRVFHGNRGLSEKGRTPGNASYYYSRTRMPTTGTVRLGGRSATVSGTSWLDREWSTSVLEAGQIGWDWFSLQLAGGQELMVFQLRRVDGTVDAASHGTWVDQDGATRQLTRESFTIEVLDHWRSSRGVRYPSAWRLRVPSEGLDARVRPILADQELDLSFRYYEGAVRLDQGAQGWGYVELVGYGESVE